MVAQIGSARAEVTLDSVVGVIDALAHQSNPYPAYAQLRDRGVHRHADGRWVVARAADITEVLSNPGAMVGFRRSAGPLGAIQRTMARFSDGPDHDRRRAITCGHLDALPPSTLRDQARELTHQRLRGAHHLEVMSRIARVVPVAVLARALGIVDVGTAVTATRRLCLALAPPSGAPADHDAGLPDTLRRVVAPVTGAHGSDEQTVNVAALLFQAMDATAGLIGNAVVAAHRNGSHGTDVEALIAATNRHDPSVHLTTRVAAAPLPVAGSTIPIGDRIVLVLASANHDDAARSDFTFGAGLRPCPGRPHALALATGVLEAFTAVRARPAHHRVRYEHRPNLRIPAHLEIRL